MRGTSHRQYYTPPTHTHNVLKDHAIGEPIASVVLMDEILHNSWANVMRKYANVPELDPEQFVAQYEHFIEKRSEMESTHITAQRLRKRFRKAGIHTGTGLDG